MHMDTATRIGTGWIKTPSTGAYLGQVDVISVVNGIFTVRITESVSPAAPVGAVFALPLRFIGGWS